MSFTAGIALFLPRGILLSLLSAALELQLPLPAFYVGAGDLNPGAHPHAASAFTCETICPFPTWAFWTLLHGWKPILLSDLCLLGPTLPDALWTLR